AYGLYESGRYDRASAVLAPLSVQASNDDVDVLGLAALIAVRQGRAEETGRWMARLAAAHERTGFTGRHDYWRARVAAVQGNGDDAISLLQSAVAAGTPIWMEGQRAMSELFDARVDAEF